MNEQLVDTVYYLFLNEFQIEMNISTFPSGWIVRASPGVPDASENITLQFFISHTTPSQWQGRIQDLS